MKIADVRVDTFHAKMWAASDTHGHIMPVPGVDSTQSLLRIITDDGAEGYCLSTHKYGHPTDRFNVPKKSEYSVKPAGKKSGSAWDVITRVVKPIIIGEDPFCRERIFNKLYQIQRGSSALNDNILSAVDLALWDLAGNVTGLPVYKLLGGHRTRIKAYASTMVGDSYEGGLDSPQAFADYAADCKNQGYKAYKLHTWNTTEWDSSTMVAKPDPKRDIEACRAVREKVGDDMVLMLDCFHMYDRQDSLYIGKELEKLNYAWLEEPMDEYNVSSYTWLCENLNIPVCGPEVFKGKLYSRAEWITNKACDICRAGVTDVGGLTPLMKIIHLCEAFGIPIDLHSAGLGTLHALAAMTVPGEYYERGLLHPFLDYEAAPPWLNSIIDPMDKDGYVHVPEKPGLGWDINFDYIKSNLIKD